MSPVLQACLVHKDPHLLVWTNKRRDRKFNFSECMQGHIGVWATRQPVKRSYLQCESRPSLPDPGPPLRSTWSVWSSGVWIGSRAGCLQNRGHCSSPRSLPLVGLDPCTGPSGPPSPSLWRDEQTAWGRAFGMRGHAHTTNRRVFMLCNIGPNRCKTNILHKFTKTCIIDTCTQQIAGLYICLL